MKVVFASIPFFLLLFYVEGATILREYNPMVPVPMNAPEAPYTWLTWGILLPDTEHGVFGIFNSGLGDAPYMGQLIAGAAEFPWLLDVRNTDLDQEGWAIGNLVSSWWAVTAAHLYMTWGEADKCGPSESGNYQVLFCTNYEYEDWSQYNLATGQQIRHLWHGRDEKGTRSIASLVRHPECTRWSREWDLMMMKLTIPIDPVPPVIGYMPIWGAAYNLVTPQHIPAVHLEQHERYNVICHVATIGRALYNVAKPPTLYHKIRYRAYWTSWLKCTEAKIFLCTFMDGSQQFRDETCEFFFDQGAMKYGNKQFECFEIRSNNGAVCEHDVGAPLVCSNMVTGFVVRGAPYHICKSGRPFPFVVVKIDNFDGGFFSGSVPPPKSHPYPAPTPDFTILPQGNRRKWDGPATPMVLE